MNDIIHVDPSDPHYLSLMEIGLLVHAYPEDDPQAQATILASNDDGETTTILGVRPARSRRLDRKTAEPKNPDGEADPE